MKKPKRILCAVLALLMLLGAAPAVSVRPAYATKTEAELEEEQRKAAQGATRVAMFSAKLVLPIPGRAARMTRSPRPRPRRTT